ncbi:DSBA family oxidoreductase [Pseudovirgaria hyperparasitica]|uniref:Glutathione S-transferase kappa n=1 Tax=Pseudovirgaria hyperparasitica TaxID=470096 RepID=A0A6A6W4C7_9PEZI|nr:DSBA family oxidoreductase [Pseudovirgaria hyperparasitica]KAF2756417.1 DSBA family oxidoreductase [Pseudovirgaria hyperparasitica]
MKGQIDAYLDCVSPYSYFGFVYLIRNRAILTSHDVEVNLIPVFLGGINRATGNKPPGSLPARGAYLQWDLLRAKIAFGRPQLTTPSFFPNLTLLPQRAMVFVKDNYPESKVVAMYNELWVAMWEQSIDISKVDALTEVFSRHFQQEDVIKILEAADTTEIKEKLNENTRTALERGAFGCPYMWIRNQDGKEEPFFGSDRFHYVWDFLSIPRNQVAPLDKPHL